jgi:hypothetical protein
MCKLKDKETTLPNLIYLVQALQRWTQELLELIDYNMAHNFFMGREAHLALSLCVFSCPAGLGAVESCLDHENAQIAKF